MHKIVVFCPGNIISGGVNSLHLLCKALLNNNFNAGMYYVNPKSEIVNSAIIKSFNVIEFSDIEDITDNVIIAPETMISFLEQFKHAKKVIYWLSVHFLFKTPPYRFPFNYMVFRKLISCSSYFDITRNPWLNIKRKLSYWNKTKVIEKTNAIHISNSHYISNFLSEFNIYNVSVILNPVREEFYNQLISINREKIILFGAKTPKKVINLVSRNFPEYNCIRCKRLEADKIKQLYQKSILFIELGTSNRDRTIREAALSGCVIITSNRGAFGVFEDTPLPDFYKLNTSITFYKELINKIKVISNNYTEHYKNMGEYVKFLIKEKENFSSIVYNSFHKFNI